MKDREARATCLSSVRLAAAVPSFILLLVGPAEKSEAQNTAEYREYVNQLMQESHEADSAYLAFRERQRSTPIDTIRFGALTVLAPTDFGDLVRAGMETVWDSISRLGSDTMLLAGKALFVPGPGWLNRHTGTSYGTAATSSQIGMGDDATDAALRIWSAVGMLLARDWDREVRDWLGGRFDFRDSRTEMLQWTHAELVTATSQAVRACYMGDLQACGSALVIDGIENPALDWYNADERRMVVEKRMPARAPNLVRLRSECVGSESDSACVEYLTSESSDGVPPPLTLSARRTLLGTAVELGGEGAYARLAAARGLGLESSLLAAAGQPKDSLLSAWHNSVLSSGPASPTLTGKGALSALIWITIFAVAATRSTRWRSG